MYSSGSKFGPYQIEAHVGTGGSGVVYRAFDTRLERIVALKFINDTRAGSQEYLARLASEAKAAARIDSPYVVKIWEYAEYEGHPCIAMEYIPGPDLRTCLPRLKEDEKIDLAIQIAEGMAAGHAQGVIHRDLKPENIKITDTGQAKILDFGLARSLATDSVDRFGNIEGTLYYLSPEQISSEPITFSSDIFSLGIILYELLTGRRPFEGEYSAGIIYAIMHEDPIAPSELSADIGEPLNRIILKALAKAPADRFLNMTELGAALKQAAAGNVFPVISPPSRIGRKVTIVDLKNLSGDDTWEYFCQGFTGDLISELSRHTDLVISSESSAAYSREVSDIFQRSRSDFVILGTLVKWQNDIRLQLRIYGDRGERVYALRKYESPAADIFKILEQSVRDIAASFAEFAGISAPAAGDYFKADATAYDFYLKGKGYYHTNRPEELGFAEKMFRKALEIDPRLAHAHSGLADLYATQYMSYYDRTREKLEAAAREARMALAIAPALPEAHRALGRYHMFANEYDKAEKCFLKAIEINPKYALGYRTLAWLKVTTSAYDQAVEWARRALQHSPNDIETLLLLSLVNIDQKKFTPALATLQRAVELAPDNGRAYYYLGLVYLKLGVTELALENFILAGKYKGDPSAEVDAGYILLASGWHDKAKTCLEKSVQSGNLPFIACYLIGLSEKLAGRHEKAATCFQEAAEVAEKCAISDPENMTIQAFWALSLAAVGEKDKARDMLLKTEQKSPDEGELLYNLARGYAHLNDIENVRRLLKKSINTYTGPTLKEISIDPHFRNLNLGLEPDSPS